MIKYGEQGAQQQINTNVKAFRKHLMANIQNKHTLWLRGLVTCRNSQQFFLDVSKTVLQKVLHDINGLFK